ncbi:hypothetical protein [Abyssicoccus albus]|uniref:hypothetical protein n=1 Tax=Abyssicoccus albus TaxID=1817405 RepID=UPI00097E343F|nr:hypothetical protein [Abyssicoccus albus]AQL55458.1 hypothetical protein BVH56_00120 [Abyssicoccus albus]
MRKIFLTLGTLGIIAFLIITFMNGFKDIPVWLLMFSLLLFIIDESSIQYFKSLKLSGIIIMIFSLLVTIAIATGLIMGSGYVMTEMLHLEGLTKTILAYIVIFVVISLASLALAYIRMKFVDPKVKQDDSNI